MKLPSLEYLFQQATDALRKHPMVIFSASFAVFFAIFLVEKESEWDNLFPLINLLLCGYLGVPLFLSVDIYTDSTWRNSSFRRIGFLVVVVVLVGIYFYLPDSEETLNKSIPYIRYAILAIAAHLLVSFASFLRRGTLNGFWQFNRVLFLRFLLAALYSGFLFVGLVLALFAIDELFKVEVPDKLYFEIFIFIAGVFNTWFFVAGVPDHYEQLDEDQSYPKGLRMFILYVLIPLLALYFLILYSYSIKIIVGWDWPSGIITYMIIAVAVLGTLAALLAYPYSLHETDGPVRFLKKGYYWILIPMIIMLYLAIGIRVAEYGVTINRYITIFLAVWLSGISIFMVAGGKDIRVIPMSLFFIILFCSFGPWGLFSVSEKSQVNRLEMVLKGAGILEDKIKNEPVWDPSDTVILRLDHPNANDSILSDSLHNEVMSILNYLEAFHGLNAIEPWFEQSPRELARKMDLQEDVVAMQLMGLPHIYKHTSTEVPAEYPSFYAGPEVYRLISLEGYDYMYHLNYSDHLNAELTDIFHVKGGSTVTIRMNNRVLSLETANNPVLTLDLNGFYQKLKAQNRWTGQYREPQQEIIYSEENDRIRVRLLIESLSANEEGIIFCNAKLLVGVKE